MVSCHSQALRVRETETVLTHVEHSLPLLLRVGVVEARHVAAAADLRRVSGAGPHRLLSCDNALTTAISAELLHALRRPLGPFINHLRHKFATLHRRHVCAWTVALRPCDQTKINVLFVKAAFDLCY